MTTADQPAPAAQVIPFTSIPRCDVCHRAAHVPGSWQGHPYTAPASSTGGD